MKKNALVLFLVLLIAAFGVFGADGEIDPGLIREVAADHCLRKCRSCPVSEEGVDCFRDCIDKTMPNCDPPAGSVCYFFDLVPPAKPHFPISGSHYHLFKMNRSTDGRCFWNKFGVLGVAPLGSTQCAFPRSER